MSDISVTLSKEETIVLFLPLNKGVETQTQWMANKILSLARDPCKAWSLAAKTYLNELDASLKKLESVAPFNDVINIANKFADEYENIVNQEINIAISTVVKPFKEVTNAISALADLGLDVMQILRGDIPQIVRYLLIDTVDLGVTGTRYLIVVVLIFLLGNVWNLVI